MFFNSVKLFKCQKNTFGIRNTQHRIALGVHKQPSVFNTTHDTKTCELPKYI